MGQELDRIRARRASVTEASRSGLSVSPDKRQAGFESAWLCRCHPNGRISSDGQSQLIASALAPRPEPAKPAEYIAASPRSPEHTDPTRFEPTTAGATPHE